MEDFTQFESTLNSIVASLRSSSISQEILEQQVNQLGSLLQKSIHDEQLRDKLSKSETIWRLIKINLEQEVDQYEHTELKIRLLRGCLLLGRNLLSANREVAESLHLRKVVLEYLERVNRLQLSLELLDNSYISAFQFLSNLTVNKKEHTTELLHEIVQVFQSRDEWDEKVLFPVFSYLSNIFETSDLLYEALSKGHGKPVFEVLLGEFERLDIQSHLSPYGVLLVKIFNKLIIHESFLKFITAHNDHEHTIRYLAIAQTIITSKQSWEVFELTVILSWNFELFQKTLLEIQDYFKSKSTEEPVLIYEKISRVLDIFSTLSHFEHARKFMLSYDGIETFVSLLGILHKNVKPKKLKDSERKTALSEIDIEYKNFPHVKSLIIETLSSLVYLNFEVQEKMRETHGLELVLSNCIIDDNEPFIKERSIVCLRFLLLNNQSNQDFVSKLEAKEAVPSDALDEAGFEVEIVDGKVKLKQKPKVEELRN